MHDKYVHTVLKHVIDTGFIESVSEISPAGLISCFVKSLTRKFPMKIHWSPQKLVFTALLKLCRIRTLVQGHLNSVMLAGKGAKAGAFYGCWKTGSLLTAPPWCSKLTYKGKATRWKIIPALTANRGRASVAGMYPAHSAARDKSRLTFPAAASSASDLAERYRWDRKCPLDTAIKFHSMMR